MPATQSHLLDNAAWAALTGPHAHLAEINGRAGRYRPDVSPFVALADDSDEQAWADLARLVGPGAQVAVGGIRIPPPEGWGVLMQLEGVQMVDSTVVGAPDPEADVLGVDDVPEMLDLVARAQPGPFLAGTIEMGTYLGIRRRGVLVAMAGERMRPPGWTEISAVCTDKAYRGQGLASRLVRAVAAGIRARGETPFLHAAASNTNAIRLYEALGFTLRRKTTFMGIQVPANGY